MTTEPANQIDDRAIAAAVTAERRSLCDLLDTLEPDEWTTRSLCSQWTVHDVAAHLALATTGSTWGFIAGMIRARGSFDRMNTEDARRHARRFAPSEVVDQIRSTAASAQRAPFSSPLDPLADILVHAQDIARPLGRIHPMAAAHVVPALDLVVSSRWYGGAKRFAAVSLTATDAAWTFGGGAGEVRGPAGDLLLVAAGRPAGLDQLTGPGVAVLRTTLA